jgi:hypothetical protein
MSGLLASVVWHTALLVLLIALVSSIRPIARLGIRSRKFALSVALSAVVFLAALGSITPSLTVVPVAATRLDEFASAYHYNEVHTRTVRAPPDRVYAAVKAVTAEEIALFRLLTSIRRFGQPGPESILNVPEKTSILEVATRTTFLVLADIPSREYVVGSIVKAPAGWRRRPMTAEAFRLLNEPGFVKATMNFAIEPSGAGSRLTTETRVYGTDTAAARAFTPYWRTIYPGSWILRVTWLSAIARRAEG